MPIPTFSGLPPYPQFEDIVNKINKLVNELRNLMLNLDTLNIVSLNAKVIEAGTITAEKIAANSITADKMDVNELSAISANLGTITAGLMQAVTMLASTITGSLIQSDVAGNYPRSEMSNTSKSFKVEGSPTASIQVVAGVPNLFYFIDSGSNTQHRQQGTLYTIQSSGRLDLNATVGGVYINGTNVLNAIANKADKGITGSFAFMDPGGGTSYAQFVDGTYRGLL